MTEISTFMFLRWEGGIEKPRLKVVNEYRTKKRGIQSRSAGELRCPYSINSLTWRPQQTWIEGSLTVECHTGMIGDHTCASMLSPWPLARSGVSRLSPYLQKWIIAMLYYLKLKYSSNKWRTLSWAKYRGSLLNILWLGHLVPVIGFLYCLRVFYPHA